MNALCKFKYYLSPNNFFHEKKSHIESKKSDERSLCILNLNPFPIVLVRLIICFLLSLDCKLSIIFLSVELLTRSWNTNSIYFVSTKYVLIQTFNIFVQYVMC